jgi:DNA mismatch repair protein MutS2
MIPPATLEQLEFHKLLAVTAEAAHSEASRKAIRTIAPLDDTEAILQRQARIEEVRRLDREGTPLPFFPFADIHPFLSRVRPQGAILEPLELAAFISVLSLIEALGRQIREGKDLPNLRRRIEGFNGHPELGQALRRSLDDEGNILDAASFLLADLRSQVRQVEARIRKQLTDLIRDHNLSNLLQDDFITQRSGRWVIPVRMESRFQIPGVVHDVSRSGETAFVEPVAIVQLSNQLENLVAEEKAEENRILRDFSSRIREISRDLEIELRILIDLDLLQSLARLADRLGMEPPRINREGSFELVQGRHPLLELSFQRQAIRGEVVPLDIRLTGEAKVMVITGSNAGGKTVALKTVGLLTLMALSGMPVPARDTSSFPLVDQLLVDMGDEQSIETSLSTFSAHIRRLAEIVRQADRGAIVLLDELGTSTDPDEGAALASAILKRLQEQGALVIATTHLAGIKVFAEYTEGMINAAMAFDPRTLTPLYRLKAGEPGLSHALDVAQRYGLDPAIIAAARGLLGEQKVRLDRLVIDLGEQKKQYETALQEVERNEASLAAKEQALEEERKALEAEKKKVLSRTYQEASDYLTAIRRRMQALMEEIWEKGRARGKEAVKEVGKIQEEVHENLKRYSDQEPRGPLTLEEVQQGRLVFISSLGYDAEVVSVFSKQKRVKVRAEGLEIEVPLLEVCRPTGIKPVPKAPTSPRLFSLAGPPGRLNLIGLRVDEALSRLEPFLNQAALGGLNEVIIVHGFGEGILQRTVREHLKGHPLIREFRPGEKSEGGGGATVAVLS